MGDYIEKRFKIVVGGDSEGGKTCLINRIIVNKYFGEYHTTLGISIQSVLGFVDPDQKTIAYNLMIWDLNGIVKMFQRVRMHYCWNSHAALLVIDLTNPSCLNNIDYWVHLFRTEKPQLPIFLVGSKCDQSEIRIQKPIIEEILKQYQMIDYFETSAAKGTGITQLISFIGNYLIEKSKKGD